MYARLPSVRRKLTRLQPPIARIFAQRAKNVLSWICQLKHCIEMNQVRLWQEALPTHKFLIT